MRKAGVASRCVTALIFFDDSGNSPRRLQSLRELVSSWTNNSELDNSELFRAGYEEERIKGSTGERWAKVRREGD